MVSNDKMSRGIDHRIHELLPSLEYRRMDEVEDRDAALKLRYDGYSQSFPVPPAWQGFTDKFDDCSNSSTFGVFMGDKLASTIRLGIVTSKVRETQAVSMYGDYLNPLLDNGSVFVDVSRLSVNKLCAEQMPELPYITFRLIALACRHYNADAFVSALRLRHIPFYKRIFGGQVVGDAVYYPPLQCDFKLVVFPLDEISGALYSKFTCFESTYLERRQLFGRADAIAGICAETEAA